MAGAGPGLLHGPSYRLALRRLVRSRKFLFAALVSLLPVVFGVLMLVDTAQGMESQRLYGGGIREGTYDTYLAFDAAMMLLGGTVPLVALLLAGGMLADDVEDRTLSYLLVRPVRRATQYRSRLAAVVTATGLLALAQAVAFAVFVVIHWAVWFRGAEYLVEYQYVAQNEYVLTTTPSGPVAAGLVLAVLAAAPLVAAGLAALFGLVSLVTTRFHFLANLLLYGFWELPFGVIVPSAAPGILTVSYGATSLVSRALPEEGLEPTTLPVAVAVMMLLFWVVAWGTVGAQVMRRKDFTVTSANS